MRDQYRVLSEKYEALTESKYKFNVKIINNAGVPNKYPNAQGGYYNFYESIVIYPPWSSHGAPISEFGYAGFGHMQTRPPSPDRNYIVVVDAVVDNFLVLVKWFKEQKDGSYNPDKPLLIGIQVDEIKLREDKTLNVLRIPGWSSRIVANYQNQPWEEILEKYKQLFSNVIKAKEELYKDNPGINIDI